MFDVNISKKYMVFQQGTSEGTQVKFYKDGYWYKLDKNGKEGLCEYLCSRLLTFSDLPKEDYILYEQGNINGFPGCRSRNFLKPDEDLLTVYRLYYNEFGRNLAEVLYKMDTIEERIDHTVSFIKDSTGLDITDYLARIFTLDAIILNEDRHVNNLAIISTENGFKPAPIFDNGNSLLSCNISVNWNFGIEENINKVTARPFSGSHKAMTDHFGKAFNIDIESALNWLSTEKPSRERDVLIYQLKNTQ